MSKVYVQDKNGKPLDPTNSARARKLLNKDRAKVIQRKPFTIKIVDRKKENSYTKNVTLGIDAGYKEVGFSAVNENEELISGVLELRDNISKKLKQRAGYRRNRRQRNTRYRKPRFDNRKRKESWLAPSIKHKLESHIKLVDRLKDILPITKVTVEVAKFDTQKMENPEVDGTEYQQGKLQGYLVRNYLLEKFNYQCAYCGKEDTSLEIEHIIPKSRGGSNRVSNLTISCHKCNQKKGSQTAKEFGHPKVQKQAKESLKSAAFMNIVRWKMVDELDCDYTFGHITKMKRIKDDLKKTHINDAFIIADGNEQNRVDLFSVKFGRRNNRKLEMIRKTFGRSIRKERYDIQPDDLIEKAGKVRQSKGCFSYGRYVKIDDPKDDYWKVGDVNIINYGDGICWN